MKMEHPGDTRDDQLDSINDAIRILTSSPDDLILSADYKDVVYTALIEFEHEWRGDRWWTPAGEIRTLGELRQLQKDIQQGRWPNVPAGDNSSG